MTMHYPKSREQWLALRRGYVSSTEAAALFGMSPYSTAFELAAVKRSPELDTFEGNERTEWGVALQLAVAKKIAADYGVKVRAMNGYATIEEFKLGASFDYEIIGPNDALAIADESLRHLYTEHGSGVLEIKTVDSLIYRNSWADDEPPAHIEIQVQTQLACCGKPWAAIGVLVGGNRLQLLVRGRDVEVGAAIAHKSTQFWALLASGKMPPVTLPEDADIIAKIYGYAEPGKVFDASEDEKITQLVREYVELSGAIAGAEKRKSALKGELLLTIKDAERVLVPGFSISTGVVAEAQIPAYTRKAYRNVRISAKKETNK